VAGRWIEIKPASGRLPALRLGELVTYRDVARVLASRQVKVRYKQAALGILWVVVQPLVTVAIFTLIFDRLAGVPSDGLPYPVFSLAGLAIWNYHSASVTAATQSLVDESELVTKVYFPRLLSPIAAVLPPLLDLAITLVLLAIVAVAWGVTPTVALVTLPLWLALAVVVALAFGVGTCALFVRFRDVGPIVTFTLQAWLFASPVLYASDAADGVLRVLLALNPVTGVVNGFRWAAVGGSAPDPVDALGLLTLTVVGAAALIYFKRSENRFADVI
jgi:lipopolysaccharide transport system permease protein